MATPPTMKQLTVKTLRRNIETAKKLTADIPCDDCAKLPHAHAKHPAWVIPHLAMANKFALGMMGIECDVPDAWTETTDGGSKPEADRARYPKKDEAMAALEKSSEQLIAAFEGLSDDVLAADLPHEGFRAAFPTIADGMHYIMAQHPEYHIGQMATWRAATGYGSPS
ncbi:MAG: DinB family protein [Planctomycetota bacterium]